MIPSSSAKMPWEQAAERGEFQSAYESLLYAFRECKAQLAAQHTAVNDAARNWRQIGYDAGWSAGYDDAMRESRHGL